MTINIEQPIGIWSIDFSNPSLRDISIVTARLDNIRVYYIIIQPPNPPHSNFYNFIYKTYSFLYRVLAMKSHNLRY